MLYLVILISFLSLGFAIFLISRLQKVFQSTSTLESLAEGIKEGADAFLKREFKVILFSAIFIFFLLWIFLTIKIALGFLLGAGFSFLAGFIGMLISTRINSKVAMAAKKSQAAAFRLSFEASSITGFLVVGLALLGLCLFWFLTKDLKALIGLGLGASLVSIFARLGGGIYTKAADVGADLAGKIEQGIPEDDPRNPAVIADQVGDNVGDCVGMTADLFETYLVTNIAAMILAFSVFPDSPQALIFPLLLSGLSIIASILASFFVRLGKDENIMAAFYRGLKINGFLAAVFFAVLILNFAPKIGIAFYKLYLPALFGLFLVFGFFSITDYYTSKKHRPVKEIAKFSQSGAGPNIIAGLAIGAESTFLPAFLICAGILVSFWLGGIYGLAISAVSFLSLTGLIIALDSYGPITDNAAGLVEMAGEPVELRKNIDALDAAGNTTKAVTKACAIGSAGLAALVLFSSYTQEIANNTLRQFIFSLEEPKVLIGLFIGNLLPYLLSSFTLKAVGRTAAQVVIEARRQFREIKGLIEGKVRPEYGRCVDIVTKAALKEMCFPTFWIVILPILTGFILGPEALAGFLIGTIISGFFIAVSMCAGGAAWDNAKKYIEEGNLGGKGSLTHQAAVIGDTVGDPRKDTVGPAMNPMIKVVNIIAILLISLIV